MKPVNVSDGARSRPPPAAPGLPALLACVASIESSGIDVNSASKLTESCDACTGANIYIYMV